MLLPGGSGWLLTAGGATRRGLRKDHGGLHPGEGEGDHTRSGADLVGGPRQSRGVGRKAQTELEDTARLEGIGVSGLPRPVVPEQR